MKLPFTFGLKLVFRLLMPGFLVAIGLLPFQQWALCHIFSDIDAELVFLVVSMLAGWLILTMDMTIYMLFEGRRFWPERVRSFFLNQESNRLTTLLQLIDDYEKSNPRKYLEASVEVRQFSFDSAGEYKAKFPTRLGNLIAAYEEYPNRVYGMDAAFYWHRIWLLLSNELREEIDGQQAMIDSTIYSSFALALNGAIFLLCAALSLFGYKLHIGDILLSNANAFLFSFVCFCISYLIYRMSLRVHNQFGEMFKSVFDDFQEKVDVSNIVRDISEKTDNSHYLSLNRKGQMKVAWRYLHNYRIKCDDCGKVMPPDDIKSHNCGS